MGLCLSVKTKVETPSPFNSGLNSKRVSGETEDFFSTSSKVSSDFSSSSSGKVSLSGSGSSNLKSFTSTELKAATRNFRADSVLGEGSGGFGSVYKGWIQDHSPSASKPATGIVVAVKRLNHDGFLAHNEWLNYNAKLCDSGPTGGKSHVSTYGYAAPEYLATGQHNSKSDVFSFGVVLLEMLSGRRAIDKNRPERQHNLVKWAKPYLAANKRKILRVLDNRLEGQCELDEVYKVATLSLRCLSTEAKLRPNMDEVVTNLEQLQVPHVSNQKRWRRKSADDVIRVRTVLAAYPHPSASLLSD